MATPARTEARPAWSLPLALAVPLAGLALLLGFPSLDIHWEHHPSHFWLVIGVALVNVAFGLIVSEVSPER
jgi:adenylate cyclase